MKFSFSPHITIGLDVGKCSTKLVALKTVKGRIELVKHAIFHCREEGLVDEEEVIDHVRGWLRELEMTDLETRIGLPQYMAMSQVSDFPETDGAQLDDMVEYEVRQLGGLTDEQFIHDYVRLKPFQGHESPVFLAECRESVLESRLRVLEPAQIKVEAIHMDGQALADTYLHNQPEDEKEKQILLLDVGGENTTLALVRDGQLLYVGSFLFGGDFFNEALAKRYGMNTMDAERMKFGGSLSMEGEADNPLLEQANLFVMELEAALDNTTFYDSQTNEPLIHAIYLSGGGSKLPEFDDYVAKHYGCPVKQLTTPSIEGDDGEFYPIAYGLALQGVLPKPHYPLSLTPESVTYGSLRRKRKLLPILTLALFVLTCVGYVGLRYWLSGTRREQLDSDAVRLAECKILADPIQSHMKQIDHFQEMLKPFVARGNRNTKVVTAIHELSRARKPGCWFYFLSDPNSFFDKKDELESIKDPALGETNRPSLFSGRRRAVKQTSDRMCYLARSVTPWEGLIFAGFVPMNEKDRMKLVRDMRAQLEKCEVFDRVDTMGEVTTFESFARRPWEDFGMFPFRFGCRFKDIEFKVDSWQKQGGKR